MSIETLLTLAVAAGILVVAAVLRFVILGSVRLAMRVSGAHVWWLEKPSRWEPAPAPAARPPRAPLGPRLATLGSRIARESVFLVTAFVEGLRLAATGIAAATLALAAWSTPRVKDAGRGATSALATAAERTRPGRQRASEAASASLGRAAAKVKPAFVLAVATLQHVGRIIVERVRSWMEAQQNERSSRPGEPTSAGEGPRVIDLERDFDPLTDEFPEDRVGTPYR